MKRAITVVSMGGTGRVRRVGRVEPGRVFIDRGAVWIAELGSTVRRPRPGDALEAEPMLRRWPDP